MKVLSFHLSHLLLLHCMPYVKEKGETILKTSCNMENLRNVACMVKNSCSGIEETWGKTKQDSCNLDELVKFNMKL